MAQPYAHTAHYVGHLLSNHPARRPSAAASDASPPAPGTGRPSTSGSSNSSMPPSTLSREALVEQLVDLIIMEEEDAAKDLMGVELGLEAGDSALDQYILSLMHKVRDDMNQVPFSPTSLPTPKRPAARPSSSSLSKTSLTFRPLTPLGSFAQPISPSASGLSSSPSASYAALSASPSRPSGLAGLAVSRSPSATITASLIPSATASSPSSGASPILSPKTLSARAVEFRPSPRAAHAVVVGGPFVGSPGSPVDWSIGSSLGGPAPSLMRSASNLALLGSEPASSGSHQLSIPKPLSAAHHRHSRIDDEEDEDDFSPFGSLPTGSGGLYHPSGVGIGPSSLGDGEPSSSGSFSSSGHSFPQQMTMGEMDELFSPGNLGAVEDDLLPAGMTPMDLLSSIFTGLSTHEVEVALHKHGYDFDSTMQYLSTSAGGVDEASTSGALPTSTGPLPTSTTGSSAIAIVAPAPSAAAKAFVPREGYVVAGGRNGAGLSIGRPPSPTSYSTKSPYGGRVCRYYLNGECRRADCRFSHDIERALCRFWLRGQCAKGEQCEFIHTLPPTFDPDTLAPAVGLDISPSESSTPTTPLPEDDDFPVLGGGGTAAKSVPKPPPAKLDSSRTRFSSAVKKAAVASPAPVSRALDASSSSLAAPTPIRSTFPVSASLSAAVPRPSARLPLRPPSLLPTLPTGASLNAQYMSARAKAIDLGTQRNAYLAKAAEAWKRGDGAAAKRFSKEGQDLNDQMNGENNTAAEKLVRDRLKIVQDAVRAREGRTTDPRDRARKGVLCGGALGVILGVASSGGGGLTSAEREEALCDVHLLHGSEAVLVLEQWLLALEAERYTGLAYVVVGSEKHTGTQDAGRGASKVRLSQSVTTWLSQWKYPWSSAGGVICVDPLEHLNDP